MQIDHLVYGVRDLDAAVAHVAHDYGLRAVERGAHPDFGTANAVLPVGAGQHLELLAAADDAPAGHPVVVALSQLVAEGDRWVGMCLRPDDLDALGAERLPYFIDWGPDAPAHLSQGEDGDLDGFAWVELGGDATRLRAWIGDGTSSLPLRLEEGPPGVRAAAVQRGDRVVVIP